MQQITEIFNSLGIDPTYILISFVGFGCLVLILSKFAFGPIAATLDARQAKIHSDLDEAQARRDEMVALQTEYSQRLAKIEEEARDKIQSAVKEAQAARDEILTRARDEAAHIVQRGREEVDSERAKSLVDARDQIVDIASAMATRAVRENLSANGQSKLIDDAIAGIGHNGSLN